MPKARQIPTEHQEQVALADWLDKVVGKHGWFHVPNEGIRDPRLGAKLKRAGLKPGVPDIVILVPPPAVREAGIWYRGTVLELKARDGARPTPGQRAWLDAFHDLGWVTLVSYGAQHAVEQLRSMGYGNGNDSV
ncbi:MAG: hypothetical protein AMJ46_12525 [Latescibacteria bacterium DG_63]|nr:MAG: hypothetical protein AMJ46_12525 [Latescibacteria bacterium DG_63]